MSLSRVWFVLVIVGLAALGRVDDSDLRRYYAYSCATLGKPYQSWFVRSADEWRESFARHEEYRPDEAPSIVPSHALRPYRDFFVEYPPGFFLVTIPPALISPSANVFVVIFSLWMGILLALSLHLVEKITNNNLFARAALGVLLLGTVSTHRYDAAVALLLTLIAYSVIERRPILLGVSLGLAGLVKLVPLIVAPLLLRHLKKGRVVAAICAAIVFLPALPWVADSVRYQLERPLQLESTPAMLLALIGGHVVRSFGCLNVEGQRSQIFAIGSLALSLAAVVFVTVRVRDPLRAIVALLALLFAFGKVLSPQYLVWILPLGLALDPFLLIPLALTQLIYPFTYTALAELRPWAIAIVLARNLALVIAAYRLAAPLSDRRGHSEPAAPPAPRA